nr:hypothetical protein [Nocardia ninae]
MRIHPCGADDLDELAILRAQLWPDGSVAEHRSEIGEQYDGTPRRGSISRTRRARHRSRLR